MNCTKFATAKAASAPAFGAKEGAAGMALGLLLLGGSMTNIDFGLKWDWNCHCGGERPALAAPSLRTDDLTPAMVTVTSAEEPAGSPLPVASEELRGAQAGAEPEARLGALSAFPSAAPVASAPAPTSSYSSSFSQAAGLEAGNDELVPMRKRR